MFQCRNIIGLLSLVIASLGPMPLWLHHGVFHASSCCHQAAPCDANQANSHCHDACQESHAHLDSDSHLAPESPLAATAPDRSGVAVETAGYLLSSAHSHDCWLCYQLSQAASVAIAMDQLGSAVVASPLATRARHVAAAAICTLCAPRGPPAAAAV